MEKLFKYSSNRKEKIHCENAILGLIYRRMELLFCLGLVWVLVTEFLGVYVFTWNGVP